MFDQVEIETDDDFVGETDDHDLLNDAFDDDVDTSILSDDNE